MAVARRYHLGAAREQCVERVQELFLCRGLAGQEVQVIEQERVVSGLVAKYGDDLTFEYRVTPELLGGLKIRVGNDVFDGSVKGRLDRLAEAF